MLKITTIQRFKVLAFRKETISNCLFIIFTLFSTTFIKAQQTNSPFSYLGIGEVATGGTAVQSAMGGLGVASSNGVYINTLNPALLARNRYTTFEMGVNMEGKIMQNDRRQSNTFGGKLNPIMLSLPASSKWTLLLGLAPVSNVDYETFSSRKLNIIGTDSVTYTYLGDGGLNKALVSNGVKVSKDMYVGLETAFMFGVINRDVTTQNFSDAQNYQVKLADRTNYSGVNFKLGWAWKPKISKNYFLNIGATADFAQNVSAKSLKRFTISDAGGINLINADTLNNTEGTITLPATYRFGISLESPAKLNVSFDYSLTQWSGFKNLNGSNEGLRDSHTFALGAEYIPKFDALNGYFNHVMYRAGVNYTTSPYAFNGVNVANDMSFSVGASFPLRTISYFNVAYVRGRRGVLATNGLEEVYNKIVIGFSLGDFYWFRKPKID
ncbi:MAG: outer membrane protein transport protein [Arcicella sp.]|nr:outer membrane protein transport protein [Arcicella sp.]